MMINHFYVFGLFQLIIVGSDGWETFKIINAIKSDTLPMYIPYTVNEIILIRIGLKITTYSDFLPFADLSVLTLDTNELTAFPNLTAIGTTLEHLSLQNNQIKVVTAEHLKPLIRLSVLDLSANKLSIFPPVSVLGNTLMTLSLNSQSDMNGIIPSGYFVGMKELRGFLFRSSNLTVMPDIQNCSQTIEIVDFQFNEIKYIQENITSVEYPSLTKFYMSNNLMTAFPNLTGFTALQEVSLEKNLINTVKGGRLPNSGNILRLILYQNMLTEMYFSDLFDTTTPITLAISMVDLSFNKLEKFGCGTISSDLDIRYMTLLNNNLDSTPDLQCLEANLEHFFIGENNLRCWNSSRLRGARLQRFSINANQLLYSDEVFLSRSDITSPFLVDVSDNPLRNLHIPVVGKDASSYLSITCLDNLGATKYVTYANGDQGVPAGALRLIVLTNQLICDYHVLWIIKGIQDFTINTNGKNMVCGYPLYLKGRSLANLTAEDVCIPKKGTKKTVYRKRPLLEIESYNLPQEATVKYTVAHVIECARICEGNPQCRGYNYYNQMCEVLDGQTCRDNNGNISLRENLQHYQKVDPTD